MHRQGTFKRALLAGAIAAAIVIEPVSARAGDEREAGPFLLFAAALTVTVIIFAAAHPWDSSKGGGTTTPTTSPSSSSSAQAFRGGPWQAAPRPSPGFGLAGHF